MRLGRLGRGSYQVKPVERVNLGPSMVERRRSGSALPIAGDWNCGTGPVKLNAGIASPRMNDCGLFSVRFPPIAVISVRTLVLVCRPMPCG
jgi:hypothetical protein